MAEEQGLSAENVRLTQMHASFMLSYGVSFRHRLNDLLDAARSEGPQPPVVEVGEGANAVAAHLITEIADDLERSIASLGYPVGMGMAPSPEACRGAAENIVAKISDRALSLLGSRHEG